jgi:predicted ATPase
LPTETTDHEAAQAAAIAREAIAKKISRLAGRVSSGEDAEVIALLAEAYANLASEPPRLRT